MKENTVNTVNYMERKQLIHLRMIGVMQKEFSDTSDVQQIWFLNLHLIQMF